MKIKNIRLNGKPRSITPLKSSFIDKKVYGFDTETINGKIYSLQIFGEDKNIFKIVEGWSEREILDYIYSECAGSFLYAHNLSFDLGVCFGNMILENDKKFDFEGYNCKIIYPHPCYAIFSRNKGGNMTMADTMPFFKMSLLKAGKFIGYKKVKMKRPEYLGLRKPRKKELKYFIKYAMLDAEICYKLALKIKDLHIEFDVPLNYSVSVASLSAKIFRKYFVKNMICPPSKDVIKIALESYHGGRTEAFAFGHVKDVKFYDINSSYPYSMSNIIIPLQNKWIKSKFLQEEGFYKIDCEIPKTKISPLPYDKNGLLQFPCGVFKNVCVAGIEAIEIKKIASKFKVIEGYVYIGKSEKYMKDFIDFFYHKKAESKNKVDYLFYKIIMNSLYGKTIQLNSDKIEIGGYVCGKGFRPPIKIKKPAGMFNPVIASWITASARINLYRTMKKFEKYVIYCDTDSIATTRKCPIIEKSKDLGKFNLEKTGSDFYIIREKKYILKNKKILKMGRHAFRGGFEMFADCIANNKNKYKVKRMIQLKESKIKNIKPFVFEEQEFIMNLIPSNKRHFSEKLDYSDYRDRFYWLKPFFVFENDKDDAKN